MSQLSPMDPLTWRTVVARCLLGSTTKIVAYTLANYASPNGADVRPGVALLVKDCELGERTVREALTKLREIGLIERTFCASTAASRDMTDEYRLTFPDDLEERVAMWDAKRQKVTKGGVVVEPPKPHKRRKKSDPPATDAGESAATDAGNRADESAETGRENDPRDGASTDDHRQLLHRPPATDDTTTGNTCTPPSHAPSHAPSQTSEISPYGAELEVQQDRDESKIELDYPTALKITTALGGTIGRYLDLVKAEAAEAGHDPPGPSRLTIAVAERALQDHPNLWPERRTA